MEHYDWVDDEKSKRRKKRRGITPSFDFFIFDEYNEIREGTPRGVAS